MVANVNPDSRDSGEASPGRLRVSAPVTFARLHIVPILPNFLAAHPGLALEMTGTDKRDGLAGAGLDIVLFKGLLPDRAHTARKIGECPRVVVGAPSYFARAGEPLSPDELSDHEAVIDDRITGGVEWMFQRGSIAALTTLKGRLHVTAAEGVREAVFAGLGFAVASEWMFAPELVTGRVRAVLQDWRLPTISLWAHFPKVQGTNPTAYAFADFIEREISKSRLH
jgi:DNA-binding transcriptional LysR family regulator